MALPTVIADYLKANVDDQKRLFFVVPKQRLPYTLPMEDVLACDQRLLEHIRDISKGRPIFIVPNQIRASLIEVSIALNAVLLSPSPIDPDRFINFTIIKEFLSKCSENSYWVHHLIYIQKHMNEPIDKINKLIEKNSNKLDNVILLKLIKKNKSLEFIPKFLNTDSFLRLNKQVKSKSDSFKK